MVVNDISFRLGDEMIFCEAYLNNQHSKAVVLMTGDSPKGLGSSTWPSVIELLIAEGYSVIAFDFISQGRSTGKRTNLNLNSGRLVFLGAINAAEQLGFKSNNFAYVASSFGASVLLHSIGHVDKPKCVVLKSPAIDLAQAYLNDLGKNETLDQWRSRGLSESLGLSIKAYDIASKTNLWPVIRSISSPTLIIHGDADEIVPIEASRKAIREIGASARLVEIPSGMHNYKQVGASETFNYETIQFLRDNFK